MKTVLFYNSNIEVVISKISYLRYFRNASGSVYKIEIHLDNTFTLVIENLEDIKSFCEETNND